MLYAGNIYIQDFGHSKIDVNSQTVAKLEAEQDLLLFDRCLLNSCPLNIVNLYENMGFWTKPQFKDALGRDFGH